MDVGFRSPLFDFFRRGEVAGDVRLLAAQGALAPRAHEQLALLLLLVDDPDPLIAATAAATLDRLPADAVARFLGRADVPQAMRDFFAGRGILPGGEVADNGQELVNTTETAPAAETMATTDDAEAIPLGTGSDAAPGTAAAGGEQEGADEEDADPQVLATLPVMARMKLAMRGTREQRAQLIRDSNKLVAAAVLSSPKLMETEVEAFARMANLSEDILRMIAMNRTWVKNYTIVAALTRNPKMPPALSMGFLQRLNERDLKGISMDRNVSEAVRLAARKFLVKGKH